MSTLADQIRETLVSEYIGKEWTLFYYQDLMPKGVSDEEYEAALLELEKEGLIEIRGTVFCPNCEKETWEGPILAAKSWDRQCNYCELNCLADAGITSEDLDVHWRIVLQVEKVGT